MSSGPPPLRDYLPDDALPPVEPPSAGFILQLFIVPGLIVVVVVTIWLAFNWLAQKGNDRDAFVRGISRNNEARWQAAFNLANALGAEKRSAQPQLTIDAELARDLAKILEREIDSGAMDEKALLLRTYLCLALGEFKVPDGLPALTRAATTERSEAEAEVRRAALKGIALAAANSPNGTEQLADDEKLRDALLEAASDRDPRTRSAAAVAMGVIGGNPFVERLHAILGDSHPDVRYNAATRLALLGDPAASEVLVEMLDPEELSGVEAEQQKDMRPFKRAVITLNALKATAELSDKASAEEMVPLREAVQTLLASPNTSGETRIEATAVMRKLLMNAERPAR